MVTEKLFLKDMYAQEAEATVLSVEENQVILDRTVFYAESGGQLGDSGIINGIRVLDTQKKNTGETRMLTHPDFPAINVHTDVIHLMDQNSLTLKHGQKVRMSIDWDRRYAIMRLHSAAHVVWHFVGQLLGDLPIKGCLIGPEKARLDFGGKIDPNALPELTGLSNHFISGSYEIQNKPLEDEPEALFWICNEVSMPCGGTHVKNTSEIGVLSLKRRSQGKQLDRLYISLE